MLRRLVLILFLASYHSVDAQLERFTHITTSDGLPENTGQAIIQDRQGFIWIGTQNGLARYDGYEYRTYQLQPNDENSLCNNQIESLFLDQDNFLWVATRNGISRFDPKMDHFDTFYPDTVQAYNRNWFCYSITQDHLGHIWSASTYGFYEVINLEQGDVREYLDGGQRRRAVAFDPQKQMLYGAAGDSLFHFKDGEAHFITTCISPITELYSSSIGLLAATATGAYLLVDNEWHRPDWLRATADLFLLEFYEDHSGNIWILSSSGLLLFNQEGLIQSWQYQSGNPESISHNLCLSFLEDNQGLFWIGTGQGINILDPSQDQFLRLTPASGENFPLPDPHVQAIHFQDASNLWVGTAKGLLHLQFNEACTITETPISEWPLSKVKVYLAEDEPVLRDDNIAVIYSENKTHTWIGTANGQLYRINGNSSEIREYRMPDRYSQLRGISRYNDKLWLTFDTGMLVLDEVLDSVYKPEWFPALSVVESGWYNGEFWMGSLSGLYIADPLTETWRLIPAGNATDELPNTMLTHFLELDGYLWICTFGGGLYRYNPQSKVFKVFSESDGLSNNNIWGSYADNDGQIWLSTDHGISKFDPRNEKFTNYDQVDGLNFEDFSLTAHAQSPGGEILFGNPEGITAFSPENISEFQFAPPLSCTEIEVNYEVRPDLLRNLQAENNSIELRPGDKTLTLKLAILSFRDPTKNQYAFSLNGYDDEWVHRDASSRQITYTDLPPGKYDLYIKAASNKGTWNEVPIHIPIVVIPPFYKTWWFRLSMGLVLLVLVGGIIFSINRRRYLRQIQGLELQQEIQGERERISRDLHDNVGAHLTKIITDLDILSMQLDERPAESNQEQIESTRGFTQNTMRLLRDTIWAIDQDEFSIEEFADKVERYLDQYLGDFVQWKVTRDITGTRDLRPNEVMNLLRIIQEATQNMLKHSRASYFEIVVKLHHRLEIEISDNGVGIQESAQEIEHYGLKNMKNRAEEISGKLEVSSSADHGTLILVSLK